MRLKGSVWNLSLHFLKGDAEGFAMTRKLAKEHGALIGSSSGAAMVAALAEIAKLPAGSQVVTIFPDAGDRYLSKEIYSRTDY